jgi:hypothetical protein
MFRLAGVVTLVCALFSLPLASSLSPKDGAGTVKFGVREARGTDLDSAIKSGEVVVFYDGLCPVCLQAERALLAVGAHIVKVPIENYESSLRERTGVSSAPSVWVKVQIVCATFHEISGIGVP